MLITMDLFQIKSQKIPCNSPQILCIPTPFDNVLLNLSVNEKLLIEPNSVTCLLTKAQVAKWKTQSFEMELLKVPLIPKIPENMEIQICYAFILRLISKIDNLTLQSECFLEKIENVEKEIESGEGLIAQTFSNQHGRLTIGTQDLELLTNTLPKILYFQRN